MKRRIFATLISTVLLLQVFCFTALADVVGAVNLDPSVNKVIVEVSGLEANSEVSLLGFVNGSSFLDDDVDYINQYTADEDGNILVEYPSNAVFTLDDIITVKVNGVDYTGSVAYATEAKIDAAALLTVKANTIGNLSVNTDVAAVGTWTSSNPAVVAVKANGTEGGTYAAIKSGIAIVTVTYPAPAGVDGATSFITIRVNP